MQFTDHAIVLSVRRHAETSGIVKVLAHEHGLHSGLVRGIAGKNNRGLYQPGNILLVTWKARLAEQMGNFTAEMIDPACAHILPHPARLCALTSATSLTELLVPERAPYVALYDALHALVESLKEDDEWQREYCRFEMALLAATGYRLDLSCCAGGGSGELVYVSPRTGRAVSREAGEPYSDKLLPLPGFLLNDQQASQTDIRHALRLTGYFLQEWVLQPHSQKMPAARYRLVETI